MRIYGLPGKHPSTRNWIEQLLNSLDLQADYVSIQQYRCWTQPEEELDLEYEVKMAATSCPDIVVSKSMGTLVALYGHQTSFATANAHIFIGTPIKMYTREEKSTLATFCEATAVLFIQQTDDPTGSYSALRASIGQASLATLVEIAGNDHRYGNTLELAALINPWLNYQFSR